MSRSARWAHLQLGRALVMSGDAVKASAAYRDFLTLWKNADFDIPILIAARAEYAKLNWFRGSPFGHPVNSRQVGLPDNEATCPVCAASSTGRCNTI
jgi:hypothetical protein